MEELENMTTEEVLRHLILTILDDDEGISEKSYDILQCYLQCVGEIEFAGELRRIVKSCNARRYIKVGYLKKQTKH